MNKRGQVFLIASIIIVGIISSIVTIQNQVYAKDIFVNEKRLAREFDIELMNMIDYQNLNERSAEFLLPIYIDYFITRGHEKGVDWQIAVVYNNVDYFQNAEPLRLRGTEGQIFYRLVSEKDGEVFVKELI